MDKVVFDFRSYKEFLIALAGPRDKRSGMKGAIAQALACQPTYISQVLHGKAHLSLEQAERLSDFLGHSPEERHYFLLLVQKDRAGTKPLQKYFQDQLEEALTRRLTLTRRLGGQNRLSPADQTIYYSSWQYAAIHIALTIPDYRTPEALGRMLGLRPKRVAEVLEFLASRGLAKREGAKFLPGHAQIRLGKSSHNIIKHHTNWRNQAIDSLEREELSDLHYSAVVSVSEKDVLMLKDRMLKFIDESLVSIRASKEEKLYSFCLDFFDMAKG